MLLSLSGLPPNKSMILFGAEISRYSFPPSISSVCVAVRGESGALQYTNSLKYYVMSSSAVVIIFRSHDIIPFLKWRPQGNLFSSE